LGSNEKEEATKVKVEHVDEWRDDVSRSDIEEL
jgi:hypothetical protein